MTLSNSDSFKCNLGVIIPIMIAIYNGEKEEFDIHLFKFLYQEFTILGFDKILRYIYYGHWFHSDFCVLIRIQTQL